MSDWIGFRDIVRGLWQLGLTRDGAVIVHASLSSLGVVRGGPMALLAALVYTCDTIVLPAFTCQSQVWPRVGPDGNGMTYNAPEHDALNREAELFHADLPAHREAGIAAETLRRCSGSARSQHPVLSFVAYGNRAREALAGQTRGNPLAPIEWLQRHDGDVLLIGVGHTRNVSLHYAEKLAGRKQFLRWGIYLDDDGQVARAAHLPGFPGCPDGFDAIAPELAQATRQVAIGDATAQRIPLGILISVAVGRIADDPGALLCSRPDCERCNAVRGGRSPD